MTIKILYAILFFVKNIVLLFLHLIILLVTLNGIHDNYRKLLIISFLTIYILFSPLLSKILLYWLEKDYINSPKKIKEFKPDAIIILGGGLNWNSSFYHPDVSIQSLIRLRSGILLKNYLNEDIPIIITGGKVLNEYAEAPIIKNIAVKEYKLKDKLILLEKESRTTKENIKFLSKFLKERKIKKVVLITSSWHLKRSYCIFKKIYPYIEVITFSNSYFIGNKISFSINDFLPQLKTPYYWDIIISELLKSIYDCFTTKLKLKL